MPKHWRVMYLLKYDWILLNNLALRSKTFHLLHTVRVDSLRNKTNCYTFRRSTLGKNNFKSAQFKKEIERVVVYKCGYWDKLFSPFYPHFTPFLPPRTTFKKFLNTLKKRI